MKPGVWLNSKPLRKLLTGVWLAALATASLAASAYCEPVRASTPDGQQAVQYVHSFNVNSLRLAIADLTATFGARYPRGNDYLAQLAALEHSRREMLAALDGGRLEAGAGAAALAKELGKLQREALLANPLLSFDRLLLVRRAYKHPGVYRPQDATKLGLPVNHTSMFSVQAQGYDNEIAVLSVRDPAGKLATLFRPSDTRYVGNMDLHFDADRLLLTMPSGGRWQVFEIRTDGTGLRQVTPGDQSDVDNYDACYLPNGNIIFCSTAGYQSVPCWNGLQNTAGLYLLDADGSRVRQLTFDQDDDCCPTVLNTGQVLLNRWEYTNTPHIFNHKLFQMNPDGTGQRNFYGSNSYWPNAVYFARAIPGHPTKVVGIVSGHHGDVRMGELVILDPARGRYEAQGAVQRIPGYGKPVEPIIKDALTIDSWPKFLHPFPLSEHYFLVSCRPSPKSQWGIYLVDVFDNMTLLREENGYALLEPIPLQKRPAPPVVADRADLERSDGTVYLQDIYAGPGLAGVPRGTVKALRVHSYHFGYRGVSGWDKIGIDGPWDVMYVLGTAAVNEDGSAMFRVPANTPIAVQPLDAAGRAVQVMRSWFTVMPGEVCSCVGCHENPNTAPPGYQAAAGTRLLSEVEDWYGPPRGFDFEREVQPVLDKYCVGCHNGTPGPNGEPIPDLRAAQYARDYPGRLTNVPAWWSEHNPHSWVPELMRLQGSERKHITIYFTPAYEALHPYVRRPGLESDYHLSVPAEYHANTSELVQMLQKGHHSVRLDEEAWDRLVTWIDLNVPCHGTWGQVLPIPFDGVRRRRELLKLYANVDQDPEAISDIPRTPQQPVVPEPIPEVTQTVQCPGWPWDSQEAQKRQKAAGPVTRRRIGLADGVTIEIVLIPAGEFVMGDPRGEVDERPLARVRMEKAFWMGTCEITNQQYRQFDPRHDSGYVNNLNTNVATRGYAVSAPQQPVVRVSWIQAMAFCRWLSERTGKQFTLPTEAQWEYACRAGTATPLSYGDVGDDFSGWGNMADASLTRFALDARARGKLWEIQPDWMLKIATVNDGAMVTGPVGGYRPNPWGLHDMHGNAGEWTRTTYRPYPYRADDGRDAITETGDKVVRGGSWYDRPKRCRSAFRLSYPAWQRVYNVGFRVVCEPAVPQKRMVDSGPAQ